MGGTGLVSMLGYYTSTKDIDFLKNEGFLYEGALSSAGCCREEIARVYPSLLETYLFENDGYPRGNSFGGTEQLLS